MLLLVLLLLADICAESIAQPLVDGDQHWSLLPGTDEFSNASVNAIAVSGDIIYFGGDFSRAGTVEASNIVMWNRGNDSWQSLGQNSSSQGVDGLVHVMKAENGKLYVGGEFERAGGEAASNIAMWDGGRWASLGEGLPIRVRALVARGNRLFAAGKLPGANQSDHVFQWDGNSWTSLEGEVGLVGAEVHDLHIDGEGRLIVAGFGRFEGQERSYSSFTWNAEEQMWHPLPADRDAYRMLQLTEGADSRLYAISTFYSSSSNRYLYYLEDSTWVKVEGSTIRNSYLGGFEEFNDMIGVPNGDIYVAGNYIDSTSGKQFNDILRWDGEKWNPLGKGLSYGGNALAWVEGKIIAGGNFAFAGDQPAFSIASWDGNVWEGVGDGVSGGTVSMRSIHTGADGMLYVSGDFTRIGDVPANHIARWNGSSWQGLGKGINAATTSMTMTSWGALMITGVDYNTGIKRAGGETQVWVAEWSEGEWRGIPGIQNLILDTTSYPFIPNQPFFEASDETLYLGGRLVGNFLTDSLAPALAKWDGNQWSLVEEVKGSVTDIAECDGRLFLSGLVEYPDAPFSLSRLLQVSASYANTIQLEGGEWSLVQMVQGGEVIPNNEFDAMTCLVCDEDNLYIGGRFNSNITTSSGQVIDKGIYSYNLHQNALESMAGGVRQGEPLHSGIIYDLALINGQLYATGTFEFAGDTAVQNIARWDGGTWHPLGSGVNGTGFQLAIGPTKELYVVGQFTEAGGKAAPGIAVWGKEVGTTGVRDEEREEVTESSVNVRFDHLTDQIIVDLPGSASGASTLVLYDLLGRKVLENKIERGQAILNTEELPRGRYFIAVELNGRRVVLPVNVQ